jgi:hypothetical protein
MELSLWQLETLAVANGIEVEFFSAEETAREYYIGQLQNVVRRVMLCHLGSLDYLELNSFVRCECGIKINKNKKVTISQALLYIEGDIEFWTKSIFKIDGFSFFKQSFLDKVGIKTI